MTRRSTLSFFVILALAGAACATADNQAEPGTTSTPDTVASATTPPTTPATVIATIPVPTWPAVPDWAEPAVVYLDAYRDALGSGDLDRIFPFLHEEVIWWGGGHGGRLRAGWRDTLTGLSVSAPRTRLPGMFFVRWWSNGEGMGYDIDWVHEAVLPPSECGGIDPCRRLQEVQLAIWQGEVTLHSVRSLAADLRGESQVDQEDLQRIEVRYEEIARRLSSGDVDEAAAMMSNRAVWEDTGDGGMERIDPRQRFAAAIGVMFAALPESQLATLTTAELGLSDQAEPAVFFIPDGALPWFGEGTIGGVGLYRLGPAPGEEDLIVTLAWVEQSHGVVELELAFDPMGLTGSAPMAADPTLWPRVPPASREPTGTIATAGGEIMLYNSSAGQQDLVEWALDRYAMAGLPSPTPQSVAFPPDYRCVLYAGLAIDTGDGVDLQVCFDEIEMCTGDACTPSLTARSTLLHELGHVWTIQHVDEFERATFLEIRGLEVWSAPDVDRDHLGTEHAAEILAWGLLEEDSGAVRLPNNGCSELSAAFRVLTGREPLRMCTD